MSQHGCPNCHYRRGPGDGLVHLGICPACGIAMGKWLARKEQAVHSEGSVTGAAAVENAFSLRGHLTVLPQRVDDLSFYGRSALWLALLLWGLWFCVHGIDWAVIGASFMHHINLPFHEFGHILFMPFGRFMAILGGSLLQVMLPLGLVIAFVFYQRDNFAGSVCLWWCGQSLVDLAPYIADAPYRLLPLVGGAGESSHDWGNLLTMLGWMDWSQGLARFSFSWGCITMGLAMYWGYVLLRKQYAQGKLNQSKLGS
jgi:hypothetical protein